MNNVRILLVWLWWACPWWGLAQVDSLEKRTLPEITITATRSERLLAAVPMPVSIISQAQIRQMGSLRLNEVLQEQTGLAIVADHGQGVQLQGFNPDYTLILIDGEPLIGRTAGTLDLTRLAVANIKQIEIIKGASSSLYGSEALAGVINIITESPKTNRLGVSGRYGSNQTADVGVQASWVRKSWRGNVFLNRYSTSGYDFTPSTFGQTVAPFYNYTLQSKLSYDALPQLKLHVSLRHFAEQQEQAYEVLSGTSSERVVGNGRLREYNINPSAEWRINTRWKAYFRLYASSYTTSNDLYTLSDHRLFEQSYFRQTFTRPEWQTEYFISDKHIISLGIGNVWESVEATRYVGKKQFQNRYVFGQYEWQAHPRWNIALGGRLDAHTVYGSQLSPKLALQYEASPRIVLRASVGRGFKAPDFRQLYLNFTNTVAGYSVYGTEELPRILEQLAAQGQLGELLLPADQVGDLQAERSTAWNIGTKIKPNNHLTWSLNVFRNDVSQLIETQTVARRTNGQNIFSYRNLNSIFTQGIETELSQRFGRYICLSGGYQYLSAKDKEVIARIRRGEIFSRDPQTLITTRLSPQDYGGLFGRSRHMLNAKIFYDNPDKGIVANLRVLYRGRYGLGDRNGNLVLDAPHEYVAGFWTFHLTLGKDFWHKQLRLMAGVDNLLNFRDELNMPNIAGRLIWASIHLNFQQ